jgi:hypothetical protein
MRLWHDATSTLGLPHGVSFDLDFHTIPFTARMPSSKSITFQAQSAAKGHAGFLAHDADTRVFCYANGQLQKAEQNDEILQFVAYWEQRTGQVPHELILTRSSRHANLNQLNQRGLTSLPPATFSQDARRPDHLPASAWRRVAQTSRGRDARAC